MKLPLEEIEGKMYQPVEVPEWDVTYSSCNDCVFNKFNKGVDCEVPCLPQERRDNRNVYFIEVTK